jgi:hypothetical protein
MYPLMIQGKNVVIVIDGQPYTIDESHINYNAVREAIKDQNWDAIPDLVNPAEAVVNYSKGNVEIVNGLVSWRGIPMDNGLTRRMIEMFKEGFPIEPMVNFMENLMDNPSKRAVNELYGFLENCDLPITPDGYFLAYKKVNGDFTDVHSGNVCNKPSHLMSPSELADMPRHAPNAVITDVNNDFGLTEVSMPRNMVNEDKDQTCSEGLHFCSKEYLTSFGGEHTLVVKINPADVVSIPSDYNNSKGRTCRYYVQSVLGGDPEELTQDPVYDDGSWADLGDGDDEVDSPDWPADVW